MEFLQSVTTLLNPLSHVLGEGHGNLLPFLSCQKKSVAPHWTEDDVIQDVVPRDGETGVMKGECPNGDAGDKREDDPRAVDEDKSEYELDDEKGSPVVEFA